MTALTSTEERAQARASERVLVELLGLERELLELSYVRRADALERAREAVRRVGDMASADGLLARAASELGSSSDFDRVLLSELDQGRLRPVALWSRAEPRGAPGRPRRRGRGRVARRPGVPGGRPLGRLPDPA